jgi:repressor LexA
MSANGVSPTYDMIKDRIGASSKSRVHDLVTGLVKRGHLRRAHRGQRALEIVSPCTPSKTKNQIAGEVVVALFERCQGRTATRDEVFAVVMEALR